MLAEQCANNMESSRAKATFAAKFKRKWCEDCEAPSPNAYYITLSDPVENQNKTNLAKQST